MWRRFLDGPLVDALADTPVVFVAGPRQSGKTTLVRARADEDGRTFVTLDDPSVLAAARSDPSGFVAGLAGDVVVDEVQYATELFLPLKAAIDRDRRPGRFLLTGSANALLLPHVATALAGRMEVLELWPLAEAEIEGRAGIIDSLFDLATFTVPKADPGSDWVARAVMGGYPEPRSRKSPDRRRVWFESYAATVLLRDVKDLAAIEGSAALPNLLALVAARAPGLVNVADLGRDAGLPSSTLKRYLALLATLFLVQPIKPWFANVGKRLVKAPRLLVVDSGLHCHLLGIHSAAALASSAFRAAILQSFVTMELLKQARISVARPEVLHFRSHDDLEVDVVLENGAGDLVGVEVKTASTLSAKDLKGLRALAELTGKRFRRGVVFYGGAERLPLGDRIEALPIATLWGGKKTRARGGT